ncbi:RagB/SusD family nutrient uptake outer membrane protein [Mucilaginibacter aquariorum]|uniref:RagB/SusD family nutrient uptake outer membrane protein n=1 Tax=Mucilaginibacter aquariorum TaxID=2967225 RepID=A0ABT1T6G4_9SPHI|nr:RagB/SusD family nutrient uptake outer membrane protein [Mucilaginibacter aquariorum]MCQ6960220.1 RagB/SusD family nutrient uptake outer membrane protein [Mucilaginibacter aquariorum]
MKRKIIFLLGAIACFGIACKKDFLNHPSTTAPTTDNYYNNAEQVNGATGILYNAVWGDWFDKAFTSVGDLLGGTVTGTQGNDQYNSFYNFNIQGTDGLVSSTWNSCYKAAGQASVLIQTFRAKKELLGGANTEFLDRGIAEARFIRGFAYFYIGRAFGDAPIVDNPLDLTKPGAYLVPKYHQKDVLRFALEDLQAAADNLPEIAAQDGRVTKYAALGLQAKIYLYMKDYPNAAAKAKQVIDYANGAGASVLGLNDDYNAMFTSSTVANKKNKENLFSLRWLSEMGWNGGNRFSIYAAPQPLVHPKPTGGSGYSAVVPSFDMLNPATGYETADKRRGWSVMQQGFHRDLWKNDSFPNGFTYDTTGRATDDHFIFTGTRSNIQKYIVGPNRGADEPVTPDGHTSMPTYILRYADVLLIYAEAVLAGGGSTSDAGALEAFNKVHNRAGLTSLTVLTNKDILHERKVEFAFEGDYWFDIQRQGFNDAKSIIASQERGTLNSNGQLTSFKATLSSAAQLFLPIPQAETVQDPKLLEPAVDYYK